MPRRVAQERVLPETFARNVDEALLVERERVARRVAYTLTALIGVTLVTCLTLMVLDAVHAIPSLQEDWRRTIVGVIKWATGGSGLGATAMFSWLFAQHRRGGGSSGAGANGAAKKSPS